MDPTRAGAAPLFELYEFIAAEWGWKPGAIEDELTDEQITGLLDASERRRSDRFDAMVESVRIGTLIAHDRKAANRWKTMKGRLTAASGGGGLTGEALERAVASLAATHPEYVVVEAA